MTGGYEIALPLTSMIITAWLAYVKSRSPLFWGAIGFIFPIISIFVIMVMGSKEKTIADETE